MKSGNVEMIKGRITLCVRPLRLRSHTEPWGETISAILNYFRASEKLRLPSYWCFVQRKQKEKETSGVRAATHLMRQELPSQSGTRKRNWWSGGQSQ